MQTYQKIDVHGDSIRGTHHKDNHDHFAIATLNKSLRLHQSNLSISDESRVHGNNQGHLFLIADGISECTAPSRASSTAIDSVFQYFLNEMPWVHLADGEPEEVTAALEDALRNAQDQLLRSMSNRKGKLETMLTLAFVSWPNLYIAHVGDSQCYLSRDQGFRRLTTDGADAGHPLRSDRPDTLGGEDLDLEPQVRHMVLKPGDRLALVTDGVIREQSAEKLRSLLEQRLAAEEVCDRLMNRSSEDDRTAIVVRFLPLEGSTAGFVDPRQRSPLKAARSAPKKQPLRLVSKPREHPGAEPARVTTSA